MNYEQKYNKYKYKYLEMLKNVKKYGSGGDDDKPASLPNASNIVSSNESVPKDVMQPISASASAFVPESVSKKVSASASAFVPEFVPESVPKSVPESVSKKVNASASAFVPESVIQLQASASAFVPNYDNIKRCRNDKDIERRANSSMYPNRSCNDGNYNTFEDNNGSMIVEKYEIIKNLQLDIQIKPKIRVIIVDFENLWISICKKNLIKLIDILCKMLENANHIIIVSKRSLDSKGGFYNGLYRQWYDQDVSFLINLIDNKKFTCIQSDDNSKCGSQQFDDLFMCYLSYKLSKYCEVMFFSTDKLNTAYKIKCNIIINIEKSGKNGLCLTAKNKINFNTNIIDSFILDLTSYARIQFISRYGKKLIFGNCVDILSEHLNETGMANDSRVLTSKPTDIYEDNPYNENVNVFP